MVGVISLAILAPCEVFVCACAHKPHIYMYYPFIGIPIYIYVFRGDERSDFCRCQKQSDFNMDMSCCWVHGEIHSLCTRRVSIKQSLYVAQYLPWGTLTEVRKLWGHPSQSWDCFLAVKDCADVRPERYRTVVSTYFHADATLSLWLPSQI